MKFSANKKTDSRMKIKIKFSKSCKKTDSKLKIQIKFSTSCKNQIRNENEYLIF